MNKNFKLSKKLINKIKNKAKFVTVNEYENNYYFGKRSPAGQDWGFYIDKTKTLEEFVEEIYKYYQDFDCSYETYLWLDNTGHGTNGAPYDMKDIYEDMEACENFIFELYELLRKEV